MVFHVKWYPSYFCFNTTRLYSSDIEGLSSNTRELFISCVHKSYVVRLNLIRESTSIVRSDWLRSFKPRDYCAAEPGHQISEHFKTEMVDLWRCWGQFLIKCCKYCRFFIYFYFLIICFVCLQNFRKIHNLGFF